MRQVLHYLPSCPKTDAGWTMEEQELFWEAITQFPLGPWTSIAAFIGTKSTRQAMTHGQKLRQKLSRWKKRLRRRAPTTDPEDHEMPQLMQLPSTLDAPVATGRSSTSASTSPSIRRSLQPMNQQQHYDAHTRIKHSPPRPSLEISPPMPAFQHSDLTLEGLTASVPYSASYDAPIVWPSAIATISSSDCHSMAMYSMPLDICTPTSTEMVPTFAAPYSYSSFVTACGTATTTVTTPTSRQMPISYVTPPAPVFATLPRSMTDISRGPVYMDDHLLSQSAMDDLAQALWEQ